MELTKMQETFFENSKIRKSDGELTPCYHWTKNRFSEFDKSTISNESGDSGYFGKGFYFTANKHFNSCCFLYPEDVAVGKEQIQLECYLNIKNPFYIEKLGFSGDYAYDRENFLQYIKDNAEYAPEIVVTEDDFIDFLVNEGLYNDYSELIEQYKADEITFNDEIEGISLSDLYYQMERSRDIITPECLTFYNIHRGILADYSYLITEYAKKYGFDGIISDMGDTPVEIVVFEPNQIKEIENIFPTYSPNFKNNILSLVQDFRTFPKNERLRIVNSLKEYQSFLSTPTFSSLCETISLDPDPHIRAEMANEIKEFFKEMCPPEYHNMTEQEKTHYDLYVYEDEKNILYDAGMALCLDSNPAVRQAIAQADEVFAEKLTDDPVPEVREAANQKLKEQPRNISRDMDR